MTSGVIDVADAASVPEHPRTESMMKEGEIRPRPDEVAETEDVQ